jgi:two-component system nitrate/nitrite response regulator NarL
MGKAMISPQPLISQQEMAALMQDPIHEQTEEPPIEIVFADPHPVVLDGLRRTFENDPGFIVKNCVHDGVSAWREIQNLQPDILVMELSLSEKDSLSLIRDLRDENLKTLPVIFTHASMLDVMGVIAVGVNGLVSKSKPKETLAECIRAVHHGQKWLDEEFAVHEMDAHDVPLTRSTFERLLTLRELSIVQLVIRGRSNREIATTFAIAEGTVKIHLKHIYQKLQCEDRVDLLSRIRRDI